MEGEKKKCWDCSSYFIAQIDDEPTEYGICLDDEAFEPYLEKIMEDFDLSGCLELVEEKKFIGMEKEACPDFEQVEIIYLDDDDELQ